MASGLLIAAIVLGALTAAADPGGDPLRPAREYLAHADTASAIHCLRDVYHDCPDASGYLLLGEVYRQLGTIKSRLRSQQVLEEARARFPDDDIVRLELGRTYFAQGLFGDAVGLFRDVLRAHPENCDANYLLGLFHFNKWKRVNEFHDDLREARRELRVVTRRDTSNVDAAFKYLIASYVLGDTSSTQATRMMRRFPHRGEFAMYRGVLDFDAGHMDDCRRDFSAGLAGLGEPSREAYAGVARIMTGSERRRYAHANADSLARAYWLFRDPDPTTETNEPALEHACRMFLSDAMFSLPGSARPGWQRHVPGWDTDRGQTFLKFGRPTTVSNRIVDDPDIGRLEVWSYAVDGVLQQFLFVDQFLNGNSRIPIEADATLQYLVESPRRSNLDLRTPHIPALMDVVAFRDGTLAASIYVTMRVDADSLHAVAGGGDPSRFTVRTAWFDSEWRRRGESSEHIEAQSALLQESRGAGHYQVVRRMSTPFAVVHIACTLEGEGGKARARAVANSDASRFIEGGLVLSDVLLTTHPLQGAAFGSITRHAEVLWPRVDHNYQSGEKLAPYLELYNLSTRMQSSDYEITYTIYPGHKDDDSIWSRWGRAMVAPFGLQGDPAIAQTFHRTGTQHDEHETIRIDISTLPPGPYRLVVGVTDNRTGQCAETRTTFRKQGTAIVDGR